MIDREMRFGMQKKPKFYRKGAFWFCAIEYGEIRPTVSFVSCGRTPMEAWINQVPAARVVANA